MSVVVKSEVFEVIGCESKKLGGVLWVAPRPVLAGYNVQIRNSAYQCYEEVAMAGNRIVWSFFRNIYF